MGRRTSFNTPWHHAFRRDAGFTLTRELCLA
jgi:hypothetical protein